MGDERTVMIMRLNDADAFLAREIKRRVVRCRDCANFRQNAHGVCWCDEYGGAITPNDYCSRAATDKQPRESIPWEAD